MGESLQNNQPVIFKSFKVMNIKEILLVKVYKRLNKPGN